MRALILGIILGWLLGNVRPPHVLVPLRPAFWRSLWRAYLARRNHRRCARGVHVASEITPTGAPGEYYCGWCEDTFTVSDRSAA